MGIGRHPVARVFAFLSGAAAVHHNQRVGACREAVETGAYMMRMMEFHEKPAVNPDFGFQPRFERRNPGTSDLLIKRSVHRIRLFSAAMLISTSSGAIERERSGWFRTGVLLFKPTRTRRKPQSIDGAIPPGPDQTTPIIDLAHALPRPWSCSRPRFDAKSVAPFAGFGNRRYVFDYAAECVARKGGRPRCRASGTHIAHVALVDLQNDAVGISGADSNWPRSTGAPMDWFTFVMTPAIGARTRVRSADARVDLPDLRCYDPDLSSVMVGHREVDRLTYCFSGSATSRLRASTPDHRP